MWIIILAEVDQKGRKHTYHMPVLSITFLRNKKSNILTSSRVKTRSKHRPDQIVYRLSLYHRGPCAACHTKRYKLAHQSTRFGKVWGFTGIIGSRSHRKSLQSLLIVLSCSPLLLSILPTVRAMVKPVLQTDFVRVPALLYQLVFASTSLHISLQGDMLLEPLL